MAKLKDVELTNPVAIAEVEKALDFVLGREAETMTFFGPKTKSLMEICDGDVSRPVPISLEQIACLLVMYKMKG